MQILWGFCVLSNINTFGIPLHVLKEIETVLKVTLSVHVSMASIEEVLNSSKVLCGITDLRKLSHVEETIFYVTSELSWHWTDTGFSGVRLLEVRD